MWVQHQTILSLSFGSRSKPCSDSYIYCIARVLVIAILWQSHLQIIL